jgi:glycosyltransferase involved in cell wall biosynthesis
MKLAVIVDTFPRWSERFIARETDELIRHGVDATIFCLKAGRLEAGDEQEWAGLLARRRILPRLFLPSLTQKNDFFLQRLKTAKKALGSRYLSNALRAQALIEQLKTGGFQHVHAHFANLPSTLAWLAAGAAGLPFTVSAHARDLFVEPQLLEEKLADAQAVFACHVRAFEYLRLLGRGAGKIKLMRHGLPLKNYPFTAPGKNPPARLLAAGRFVPKKGFAELLQALAVNRAENFQLTLLGEGPEAKILRAKIRETKLQQKVRLAFPLGGPDFRAVLAQAGAFIAPSQPAPDGDSDGVPNVVLEAFALGVPVIGAAAPGLSEVLTPETGTVVQPGDIHALARAIQSFLHAPEEARQKTFSARALIEREYDLAKNIAPLLQIINEPARSGPPDDKLP